MSAGPPPELAALVVGRDTAGREAAWSALLQRYHRLLLKAAASLGGDHDARMERYSHVLEELRRDDYRRLRAYQNDAKSSFGAWLLVVARRLCLDYERRRFGRGAREPHPPGVANPERSTRRRLAMLTGAAVDPDDLPEVGADAEAQLAERELHAALAASLDGLEPRDRLLLRLRFEDGLSVREIASLMSFPSIFHVYHRLKPVLAKVRERLKAQGIDEATP
jgi:RNA polymerase sigma factor (sigma-70 family)